MIITANIYSFLQMLFKCLHIPGTVLGPGYIAMNRTDRLLPSSIYMPMNEIYNK